MCDFDNACIVPVNLVCYGIMRAQEVDEIGERTARNRRAAPARNAYNTATYHTIAFRLRRDGGDGVTAEQIKAAAQAAGQSVNAWIIEAIKDRL